MLFRREKEKYLLSKFLKDFWQYTRGFHKGLIVFAALLSFSSLQGLLPQVLLAKIVDGLASRSISAEGIALILTIFAVNALTQTVVRLKSKFYLSKFSEKVRLGIRQWAISELMGFDLEWHESRTSGKKITIVSKGADNVKSMIRFLGRGGTDILVGVGGVLIIFLGIGRKYFVISLINGFLYLLINHLVNRGLTKRWHRLNKEYERVIGKNFDYFSNINLIKKLGIADRVNKALFKRERDYSQRAIDTSKKDFNKWIYIQSISQVFYVITLLFVVLDIISGRVSIGSFFIYTGYVGRFQNGLSEIASWIGDLIEMKLGFWRLVQLMNSGRKRTDIGDKKFPEKINLIQVKNVSFKYKTSIPVIKNLNLKIKGGEKVGFVGESGSGKSTLTKLFLRLYLLNKGKILINNINLNEIKTESLRENVAIIPQESEIFNLSFMENVTIASPRKKFDREFYNHALKIAECGPILEKIKNNHRTLLGEKGIKLSGGERQRLGIARAVYKDSPLMIFDESTSSLDSKTEKRVLDNIEKHLAEKTIVWAAHRLSTLRFTDKIFVFDKGRIVEEGSFKELVEYKGLFHQLWSLQKKTKLK